MSQPQTETRGAAPRFGWAQRLGLSTILTALTVIASYWAIRGWIGVAADWLGITGLDAYLLFGLFEGTIIALVLVAVRTRLGGDAAIVLWIGVWSLTGLAVGVQVYHAVGTEHPESALVYGSASLVTVLLWQLKTRQANREALRELELIADPTVRLGVGLWFRFPRWSWRAQTVARWEGLSKPSEALRRAQHLYPAGTMPWEKAHRRASRKAARRGGREALPKDAPEALLEAPLWDEDSASEAPFEVTQEQIASATQKQTRGASKSASRKRSTTDEEAAEALLLKHPKGNPSKRAAQALLSVHFNRVDSIFRLADQKRSAQDELSNVTPIHKEVQA